MPGGTVRHALARMVRLGVRRRRTAEESARRVENSAPGSMPARPVLPFGRVTASHDDDARSGVVFAESDSVQHAGALLEPVSERVPVRIAAPAVDVRHVRFAFDDQVVLRDISFSVPPGDIRFLFGASGSGKSVLLKLIAGLLKPDGGTIEVHGQRIDNMSERELMRTRGDIGLVFQENALFDSLTVGDNVGYRLYEETAMPEQEAQQRVEEVLRFVGLPGFAGRMPSELSGGERRRVGIGRAMAAKPRVLLYDDPTTGLDPITSITIDNEIIKLRDLEGVTSIVATHQIRDAFYIATHRAIARDGEVSIVSGDRDGAGRAEFMVLYDGRIHFSGPGTALLASRDRYLQHFLRLTLPPW
jgi:phospholipid/cholesterol/gamma-HCH transport system ATP-binding protein